MRERGRSERRSRRTSRWHSTKRSSTQPQPLPRGNLGKRPLCHVEHAHGLMEEGTKSKKTVFVGGIGDDVDETVILENFSPFGTRSF